MQIANISLMGTLSIAAGVLALVAFGIFGYITSQARNLAQALAVFRVGQSGAGDGRKTAGPSTATVRAIKEAS